MCKYSFKYVFKLLRTAEMSLPHLSSVVKHELYVKCMKCKEFPNYLSIYATISAVL